MTFSTAMRRFSVLFAVCCAVSAAVSCSDIPTMRVGPTLTVVVERLSFDGAHQLSAKVVFDNTSPHTLWLEKSKICPVPGVRSAVFSAWNGDRIAETIALGVEPGGPLSKVADVEPVPRGTKLICDVDLSRMFELRGDEPVKVFMRATIYLAPARIDRTIDTIIYGPSFQLEANSWSAASDSHCVNYPYGNGCNFE